MQFFISAFLFLIFSAVSFCSAAVPEGFREHKVQKGDTLFKIAPREHWDIIERINRIDESHLIIGQKILLPSNWEAARKFLPVPANLAEAKPFSKALFIFLDCQYFGAYEKGQLVFWGPISSGNKKYPTPAGKYQMLWKSRYYISKKYGMPMPYAVNFSADGYFMHQQSLPGRPASHGCVRLRRSDARLIYDWIEKGDKIILTQQFRISELFFYFFSHLSKNWTERSITSGQASMNSCGSPG